MADAYPFLKGHGTENDFVLLPDHDGTVHGDLTPGGSRALCDRRAGIGGDGVLRVVRTAALRDRARRAGAEWFMDYRNGDGSLSEMCGNGIRVFARHLADEGLVDAAAPVPIGTRGRRQDPDLRRATPSPSTWARRATWGRPRSASVTAPGPARHVDMGNPHAVAFVDDLADAGRCWTSRRTTRGSTRTASTSSS